MALTHLPYCEGYPRLIGTEMRRAASSDECRTFCRFFTRSEQPRGWLEVLDDYGDDAVVTRWKFTAPGVDRLVGRFPITFDQQRGKVGRPAPFRCRRCKRRTGVLVYKDVWACAKCQGLRNRSTFLPRNVRDEERAVARLAELTATLAKGRPPYVRHSTYRNWQDELKRSQRAAPTLLGLKANRDRQEFIESEWLTEGEARDIHGFEPDTYFTDG